MSVGVQQQFWAGPLNGRERGRRLPAARTPLVDESVIHDLLNPITSIVGHLHLMEDAMAEGIGGAGAPGGVGGEGGERWLAAGRSGVEELTDMLVDLRRLMQLETGELKLDRRPLDVAALLERVRDLERERAELRNQTVRIAPAAPGLRVHAGAELLERALRIVLAAALRLGRSTPILLRADRIEGGGVRFRCCYEGRAMTPRLADRLFTRDGARLQEMHGQRIDRARGLLFVRAVAEVHAGRAWCEPTPGGACFYLELPMND